MEQYNEILAMMTVIFKKLDEIEREVKHKGWRTAPDQTYLDELRSEAEKIKVR